MFNLLIEHLNKKVGPVPVLQAGLIMCAIAGVFGFVDLVWNGDVLGGVAIMLMATATGMVQGFGLLFLRSDD